MDGAFLVEKSTMRVREKRWMKTESIKWEKKSDGLTVATLASV
jgi:hypothetical protein